MSSTLPPACCSLAVHFPLQQEAITLRMVDTPKAAVTGLCFELPGMRPSKGP